MPTKCPKFVFAKPADGWINCMNYSMVFFTFNVSLYLSIFCVYLLYVCLGFYKAYFKDLSELLKIHCIVLYCVLLCGIVLC